jgi:hypothetical protein
MKQCSECQESKPLEAFRNRKASKDGKESRCKECRRKFDNNTYKNNQNRRDSIRAQMRERSLKLKRFVRDYLSTHPCVDCGQNDPDLLEFDHVSGDKRSGIGAMIAGACKMESLVDEIAKCEVRCLYCHRKRTIKQFGWYSWV